MEVEVEGLEIRVYRPQTRIDPSLAPCIMPTLPI
jgi:hypothetical protein